MKLTKEQAITKHREMWNWIADKLEEAAKKGYAEGFSDVYDLKRQYIKKYENNEDVLHNCYCCEYANEKSNDPSCYTCDICPILWGSENKGLNIFCETGLVLSDCIPEWYYDGFKDPDIGLWLLADILTKCYMYEQAAEIARKIANLPEREE